MVEGEQIISKIDATNAMLATAILSTPIWVVVLKDISVIASAVAALCGAIVGLHTVWRIFRKGRSSS